MELNNLVADEVRALGYILWGMEVIPGRFSCLVRVYIDILDAKKPNIGISVEDCARVNRQLSLCLREENYVLEVSSPGLARKFFQPQQYTDYIGKQIRVRTRVPIDGQRNFLGRLIASDENTLSLSESDAPQQEQKLYQLMHVHIEKGQLEPDYTGLFKK